MDEDRPNVGTDHVDVVEVRVRAVLQQPGTAWFRPHLRHGHGFARPVYDLRPVECERSDRFRVFAVAAADRAQVADVLGAEDGVEGVDSRAKELDPAIVDVVGCAGALSTPDVVLGGAVDDLAPGETTNSVLKKRSG